MATAKKAAAPKKAAKKIESKVGRGKGKVAKPAGKGGVREGAGASQLVPNKVRKTIDIPEFVAHDIINKGNSDVSAYMRKATYNQMVTDGIMTRKKADELINWKKKVA